jgi:hypothetical protein
VYLGRVAVRPPTPGGGELRSGLDLEALLNEARRDLADDIQPEFARGIVASTLWVLGAAAHAPLSAETISRPTLADVRDEEERASRTLYGELGPIQQPRAYIVGVEHTLMWARGIASSPPIALDDAWMDQDPYVA